ncbi:MAG: hypothetical protein AAGA48_09130 [Myxococcota bacterium]
MSVLSWVLFAQPAFAIPPVPMPANAVLPSPLPSEWLPPSPMPSAPGLRFEPVLGAWLPPSPMPAAPVFDGVRWSNIQGDPFPQPSDVPPSLAFPYNDPIGPWAGTHIGLPASINGQLLPTADLVDAAIHYPSGAIVHQYRRGAIDTIVSANTHWAELSILGSEVGPHCSTVISRATAQPWIEIDEDFVRIWILDDVGANPWAAVCP